PTKVAPLPLHDALPIWSAPAERTEHRRVPDLGRRHVERAQLGRELLRIVDQRKQIGERDQLTVVEQPAHEARVVVTPLLAVGDEDRKSTRLNSSHEWIS